MPVFSGGGGFLLVSRHTCPANCTYPPPSFTKLPLIHKNWPSFTKLPLIHKNWPSFTKTDLHSQNCPSFTKTDPHSQKLFVFHKIAPFSQKLAISHKITPHWGPQSQNLSLICQNYPKTIHKIAPFSQHCPIFTKLPHFLMINDKIHISLGGSEHKH